MQVEKYQSFNEFYPFYLSQHQNSICKILHYFGLWMVLGVLSYALYSSNYYSLILCPLIGYFCAWVGHFFFEKNRPATFTYPIYSLMGDWRMFFDITIGRVSLFKN